MKTLRIVIAVLFFATTLAYTVAAAAPMLVGPLAPTMECYGYACYPMWGSCPMQTPNRMCDNVCIVGGYERCMDGIGWRCVMFCAEE